MITMSLIQDTINADPLKLVSALSKVESDLMQNITNSKDKRQSNQSKGYND